jgi:hypothetical protein
MFAPHSYANVSINTVLEQDLRFITFFFLISNSNLLKSAKGRNPYTREVYKRALKRVERKVNLKSLQK